jgi:hypothetical protein
VAETVGSIVDKMTIIELKIFHMREQAERDDVSAEFRTRCHERLAVMWDQRDDLAAEITRLVTDMAGGRVVPKIYRQFKMYNDPQYRRDPAKG